MYINVDEKKKKKLNFFYCIISLFTKYTLKEKRKTSRHAKSKTKTKLLKLAKEYF